MRWEDNSEAFLQGVRTQLAARLLTAATLLQTSLKQELSTAYPPASVPGQYPHGRTWHGRNSVVVVPDSLPAIAQSLVVRIGFTQNAWYMSYLEAEKDRLGLQHKYREMRGQLQAILGGGA